MCQEKKKGTSSVLNILFHQGRICLMSVCHLFKKKKKTVRSFTVLLRPIMHQRCCWIPFLFISRAVAHSADNCLQSPSFFVALMLYQAQGAVLMESYLIASIPLLLWHSSTKNCFEALSVSSVMQTDSSFNMISDT